MRVECIHSSTVFIKHQSFMILKYKHPLVCYCVTECFLTWVSWVKMSFFLTVSLSNDFFHSMAVTWEEIEKETRNDKVLSNATNYIEKGRSLNKDESLSMYLTNDVQYLFTYPDMLGKIFL